MKRRIINTISPLFLIVFMIYSCNTSEKNLLHQKWKTIKLSNAKMEAEIKQRQLYIDTLGQADPELRKSVNVDSLKKAMQLDLTKSLEAQRIERENTLMEFASNGVVYTTSVDGSDSAMYTLENNFIKIDETKLKGYGETMTFEILRITTDTLNLRLIDFGDTSLVTMVPVEK